MKRKWLKITSIVTVAAMLLAGCGSQTKHPRIPVLTPDVLEAAADSAGAGTRNCRTAEPGSITYPLNSDTTISWYAQQYSTLMKKSQMHPSHHSIRTGGKAWCKH